MYTWICTLVQIILLLTNKVNQIHIPPSWFVQTNLHRYRHRKEDNHKVCNQNKRKTHWFSQSILGSRVKRMHNFLWRYDLDSGISIWDHLGHNQRIWWICDQSWAHRLFPLLHRMSWLILDHWSWSWSKSTQRNAPTDSPTDSPPGLISSSCLNIFFSKWRLTLRKIKYTGKLYMKQKDQIKTVIVS